MKKLYYTLGSAVITSSWWAAAIFDKEQFMFKATGLLWFLAATLTLIGAVLFHFNYDDK